MSFRLSQEDFENFLNSYVGTGRWNLIRDEIDDVLRLHVHDTKMVKQFGEVDHNDLIRRLSRMLGHIPRGPPLGIRLSFESDMTNSPIIVTPYKPEPILRKPRDYSPEMSDDELRHRLKVHRQGGSDGEGTGTRTDGEA